MNYLPEKTEIRDFVLRKIAPYFEERTFASDIDDVVEVIRALIADSIQRCLTAQGQFSILENDKQEKKASRP